LDPGFAADGSHPADGTDKGTHPYGVDEVEMAQVDVQVGLGTKDVVYCVPSRCSTAPVQAASGPTDDAEIRADVGVDHLFLLGHPDAPTST